MLMGHETGQPVSLAAWKALASKGEAPADAILHKQYIADSVKAVDGSERKVAFTISTGAIDRDADTLKAEGWKLDSYRSNPVVLWAHNRTALPVGKAESVRVQAGTLKAIADFVPVDMNPLAESVLRMLKGGYLRATSVGFIPVKFAFNEERMGYDFSEQELLEFSVVPVPANPEALMDAKAAGIDMAPVKDWAEQILDGVSGKGLWVPKEQAEAVFRMLSTPKSAVAGPGIALELVRALSVKVGRTISAANQAKLQEALTSIEDAATGIGNAVELVEDVLGLAGPGDEPEGAGKQAPVLLMAPPAPTYTVNPADLRAAMVAAVSDEVRAAINHARGRVD